MAKVEYMISGYSITLLIDGVWYCIPAFILFEYSISLPWGWTQPDLVRVKAKILASPVMNYIKAFRTYDKVR